MSAEDYETVSATPPPSAPSGSTPGTVLARPRLHWRFRPYRRTRPKLRSAKPARSGARLKYWSIRSRQFRRAIETRQADLERLKKGQPGPSLETQERRTNQRPDRRIGPAARIPQDGESRRSFWQNGFPSVRQAQEALNDATLDLERTTVKAPADGIVANFQLTEGTYIQTGVPVATLIDTTRWRLVAAVPENWLEKIRPGDEVYYSLRNYPGRIRTAKVEYVGRGVVQGQGVPSGNLPDTDPRRIRQTDTPQAGQEFQVVIHLQDDQPNQPLRVGATGRVTIF